MVQGKQTWQNVNDQRVWVKCKPKFFVLDLQLSCTSELLDDALSSPPVVFREGDDIYCVRKS